MDLCDDPNCYTFGQTHVKQMCFSIANTHPSCGYITGRWLLFLLSVELHLCAHVVSDGIVKAISASATKLCIAFSKPPLPSPKVRIPLLVWGNLFLRKRDLSEVRYFSFRWCWILWFQECEPATNQLKQCVIALAACLYNLPQSQGEKIVRCLLFSCWDWNFRVFLFSGRARHVPVVLVMIVVEPLPS